jgi:hypothetical protein
VPVALAGRAFNEPKRVLELLCNMSVDVSQFRRSIDEEDGADGKGCMGTDVGDVGEQRGKTSLQAEHERAQLFFGGPEVLVQDGMTRGPM